MTKSYTLSTPVHQDSSTSVRCNLQISTIILRLVIIGCFGLGIALLNSQSLLAQLEWRQLEQPYGGQALFIFDSEYGLLASEEESGVWVSNNEGDSWTRFGDTTFIGIPLFTRGSTIYAIAPKEDGFYRSTNGGESWDQRGVGLSGEVHFSVQAEDGTLYTLTDESVFRSTDNGEIWLSIGKGLMKNLDAIRLGPDGTLYAVGGDNLRRTVDGGENWTTSTFTPDVATVRDVLFLGAETMYAATDEGLYRSTDNGLTFLPSGVELSNVSYFLGNRFLSDGWFLVNTTDGHLYKVNPGGTQSVEIDVPERRFMNVTVYGNDAIAIAFSGIGIWISKDGGSTWKQTGIARLYRGSITTLPDNSLLLFDYDGTFQSVDGGENWRALSVSDEYTPFAVGAEDGTIILGRYFEVLVQKPGESEFTTYELPGFGDITDGLLTANGTLLVSHFEGVSRSTDTGRTFTSVLGTTVSHLLQTTSGTIFGYNDTAIYRSTDGGATFSRFALPVTMNRINYVVATQYDGLIVDGENAIDLPTFVTDATGDDWAPITLPCSTSVTNRLTTIDRFPALSADCGLYLSYDNGTTWSRIGEIPDPETDRLSFAFLDDNLFLANDEGVFRTSFQPASVRWNSVKAEESLIRSVETGERHISVHIDLNKAEQVSLHLYDGNGRTIRMREYGVIVDGRSVLDLDFDWHLSTGVYFVEVSAGGSRAILPCIIVR